MLEIGKYIATQLYAPEAASKLLYNMEKEIKKPVRHAQQVCAGWR